MIWTLLLACVVVFNTTDGAPTTTIASTATTEICTVPDYLKDIISVIPKDLIKNITDQHLKTDEGFRSAVKYMQTDEWKKRIQVIKEKPEWVALKKYLKGLGINVDIFIKLVEGYIQNVNVTLDPGKPASKKTVKAFLLDVEQNLPTLRILTAIHENMVKDAKLQDLFEKISADETRKMVDKVLELPEIKKMVKDLSDMDLNFAEALVSVYALMGWGQPKI
ncbi:hypothetical protein NQ315_004054 [Exocentrus adspersus]|uniref:Uncharacterized protein n=1 Tax=Exocentrus adspersus TaxID=1586481 RepID=A0AAV8W659_9CUCU|nr:hypothetical protein NQ315_004054 [Exocentrus adspersus]